MRSTFSTKCSLPNDEDAARVSNDPAFAHRIIFSSITHLCTSSQHNTTHPLVFYYVGNKFRQRSVFVAIKNKTNICTGHIVQIEFRRTNSIAAQNSLNDYTASIIHSSNTKPFMRANKTPLNWYSLLALEKKKKLNKTTINKTRLTPRPSETAVWCLQYRRRVKQNVENEPIAIIITRTSRNETFKSSTIFLYLESPVTFCTRTRKIPGDLPVGLCALCKTWVLFFRRPKCFLIFSQTFFHSHRDLFSKSFSSHSIPRDLTSCIPLNIACWTVTSSNLTKNELFFKCTQARQHIASLQNVYHV